MADCCENVVIPPNPCDNTNNCKQLINSHCVVNAAALDCLGLPINSRLDTILSSICTALGLCCSTPSTYTITSICNGDPPSSVSNMVIVPNFTYPYPLVLHLFASFDGGTTWLPGGYSFPLDSTVDGVSQTIYILSFDTHGSADITTLSDALIKVIDNQSNASTTFQIPNPIETC
jgi:hypothetical protein